MFVFGDYEGVTSEFVWHAPAKVPTDPARAGNLCSPPDCSTTHTIKDPVSSGGLNAPWVINPAVLPYLPLWPEPNGQVICHLNSPPPVSRKG